MTDLSQTLDSLGPLFEDPTVGMNQQQRMWWEGLNSGSPVQLAAYEQVPSYRAVVDLFAGSTGPTFATALYLLNKEHAERVCNWKLYPLGLSVKSCWNTPSVSSRFNCWSSTYSSTWKWPNGCFPLLAPALHRSCTCDLKLLCSPEGVPPLKASPLPPWPSSLCLRKCDPELASIASLVWRRAIRRIIVANKRGRDSKTGEFITISDAKKRPNTTTVETIPPPKKPPTKKK